MARVTRDSDLEYAATIPSDDPGFNPTMPATPTSKAIVGDASWSEIEHSRVREISKLNEELEALSSQTCPPPPSSSITAEPTLVYDEESFESEETMRAEHSARQMLDSIEEIPMSSRRWVNKDELPEDVVEAHERGVMSNDQMATLLRACGDDEAADMIQAPPANDSLAAVVAGQDAEDPISKRELAKPTLERWMVVGGVILVVLMISLWLLFL